MKNAKNEIPLNPIVFSILQNLIGKTLHGYKIKKRVEADLDKAVPTATLYRHLRRMLEDGMLEEVEMDIEDDDPRRQYFKLTMFGTAVYGAEYNRLREAVLKGPGPDGEPISTFV
ncbi:MAG: PadR family transcriptional regulator [Chloroflexota bacterium]